MKRYIQCRTLHAKVISHSTCKDSEENGDMQKKMIKLSFSIQDVKHVFSFFTTIINNLLRIYEIMCTFAHNCGWIFWYDLNPLGVR